MGIALEPPKSLALRLDEVAADQAETPEGLGLPLFMKALYRL